MVLSHLHADDSRIYTSSETSTLNYRLSTHHLYLYVNSHLKTELLLPWFSTAQKMAQDHDPDFDSPVSLFLTSYPSVNLLSSTFKFMQKLAFSSFNHIQLSFHNLSPMLSQLPSNWSPTSILVH